MTGRRPKTIKGKLKTSKKCKRVLKKLEQLDQESNTGRVSSDSEIKPQQDSYFSIRDYDIYRIYQY